MSVLKEHSTARVPRDYCRANGVMWQAVVHRAELASNSDIRIGDIVGALEAIGGLG